MYTLLLTSVHPYRIHSRDHFSSYGGDAVQRVEYKCLYSMFTSHLLCICLACGRSPLTVETIISISIAITHPITLKWPRMWTYITERWTFFFFFFKRKKKKMGGWGGGWTTRVSFFLWLYWNLKYSQRKKAASFSLLNRFTHANQPTGFYCWF